MTAIGSFLRPRILRILSSLKQSQQTFQKASNLDVVVVARQDSTDDEDEPMDCDVDVIR